MASATSALGMLLLSALGYAGATVVMARLGAGHPPGLFAVVAAALLLAVFAEIAALRHMPIVVVYLAILGLETLIVLVAAAWLGQAPGLQQLLGATLVLGGTVLLVASHG